MKKIFLIANIFFILQSCKAQTPVISLYDQGIGRTPNAYYKDTDNDFNKFVGRWKYTNGTTSLIIEFKKRTMHFDTKFNIYLDMLVGEYQYIEGGVLKTNTLSNLDNTNLNLFQNTISGTLIMPPCKTCPTNEREVSLDYIEPNRKYLMQRFDIRHYTELGDEFLRINHSGSTSTIPSTPGAPVNSTLPEGTYILEKL